MRVQFSHILSDCDFYIMRQKCIVCDKYFKRYEEVFKMSVEITWSNPDDSGFETYSPSAYDRHRFLLNSSFEPFRFHVECADNLKDIDLYNLMVAHKI